MKLTPLLCSHAVVQRDCSIPVWGWTDRPNVRLRARLGGSEAGGISSGDGSFRLRLPALEAGGPHRLTVETLDGHERVVFDDILVGEVWLASGQSNMEWSMQECLYEADIRASHPGQIRMFTAGRRADYCPQSTVCGEWDCSSPATTGRFSAVATVFGNRLQDTLGVPVGMIHASWGGTFIQTWISREKLLQNPQTHDWVLSYEQAANSHGDRMSYLEDRYPVDPGNSGVKNGWNGENYDDGDWGLMPLPCMWQDHGYGVSGIVWFRKRVELPDAWRGKDLALHLGAIDKHDITYVSGVEVGRTGSGFDCTVYNQNRCYHVPAALTDADALVIAVRVYSFAQAGGMTGPQDELCLRLAGDDDAPGIPLGGEWRFQFEHDFGFVDISLPGMGHGVPNSPYMLFDNMIRPLLPVAVAGVIWYQGESNAGQPQLYASLQRDLIEDWRYHLGNGAMPFGIVQLPNFGAASDYDGQSSWAQFRAVQTEVLDLPGTGMAVTIDCGEADDIHPKDKKTVGFRLAQWALSKVYGQTSVVGGAIYSGFRREGATIRVLFEQGTEGLATRDGDAVKTLFLAGEDGVYHQAQSRIEGSSLLVWHEGVPEPRSVAYAWSDNPEGANLINAAGFPVAPFRTA